MSAAAAWRRLGALHLGIAGVAWAGELLGLPGSWNVCSWMMLGQMLLLGAWVGLSEVRARERWAVLSLACLVLIGREHSSLMGASVGEFILDVLIMSTICGVIILIFVSLPLRELRERGWQIVAYPMQKYEELRWQFSIKTILGLTTVVAILATFRRFVISQGIVQANGSVMYRNLSVDGYAVCLLSSIIVAAGFGAFTFSAVRSCLTVDDWRPRLLTTAGIGALVCFFPFHAATGKAYWGWAGIAALNFVVVVASLLMLRRYGVRLVPLPWQRSNHRGGAEVAQGREKVEDRNPFDETTTDGELS